MSIIFLIIGVNASCIFLFYFIGKLFGPCNINHDDIARQGAEKCPRCNKEI